MPLTTHHVDFSFGIVQSFPVGMFSLIGGDGNHYVISTDPDLGGVAVCCAETDSRVKNLQQSDFRTAGTNLGFSLAATTNFNNQCVIPIHGTDKFYLTGTKLSALGVSNHGVMLIRYKIVNTSSIIVDGGFYYVTSAHKYFLSGYCWGARTIGGVAYAVCDTGTFSPPTQTNMFLALPLAGTLEDLSVGSWDPLATDLGPQLPWTTLRPPVTPRGYFNRISIVTDQSFGFGIYYYWGQSEADLDPGVSPVPTMFYLGITPGSHTIGTLTNVSSQFSLPFSDTHKKYDGSASADPTDDYSSPSVTSNELILTRPFSDNKQYYRYQRYFRSPNGVVTFVDSGVQQCSTLTMSTVVEFIELYREGNDLNSMCRDTYRFMFLGFTLAPPVVGGSFIPKVRHS